MNLRKITKQALVGVASAVAAAGAVLLLPEAAVPAVVLVVAKQVVAWGTTAGVIAGAIGIKGMDSTKPGKKDARGQISDDEDPK
jgi:hypothetical protein